MKPSNMKTSASARTASWQYDSADYAAGLDNKDHPSYRQLPNGGNQHGGVQNPNALINKGRGATRGNTGKTANEGPKQPQASPVPNYESAAARLKAGTFNAGAQDRTPGGTRSWAPSATENFTGNIDRMTEGRGPTRGNKQ